MGSKIRWQFWWYLWAVAPKRWHLSTAHIARPEIVTPPGSRCPGCQRPPWRIPFPPVAAPRCPWPTGRRHSRLQRWCRRRIDRQGWWGRSRRCELPEGIAAAKEATTGGITSAKLLTTDLHSWAAPFCFCKGNCNFFKVINKFYCSKYSDVSLSTLISSSFPLHPEDIGCYIRSKVVKKDIAFSSVKDSVTQLEVHAPRSINTRCAISRCTYFGGRF